MAAEIVALVGGVLILLGSVGVVRFDDTLARTHALTKATSLGIVLVLLGAAYHVDTTRDSVLLVLTAVLQVLTTPVAGHLIGRAVYRSGLVTRVDAVDELAQSRPVEPPEPAHGDPG